MTAHAKLSASGSPRWLACPGSVAAEAALPPEKSGGIYAEEGTAAHALAEWCLSESRAPFGWEGRALPGSAVTVTREMCNAVQQYLDYCHTVPGRREIEQRVDFSEWVPDGFGTSDMISVADGVIHVVDLKYGKGVRVDAEGNSQMLLYALGAYNERSAICDIRKARMVIVQPRLDHISEAEINIAELLKWGEWASQRAEIALSDDAPRAPGEKPCQWCRAKAKCPALDKLTRDTLAADFEELTSPSTLSDARLREVLEAKKLITGWLDAVEAHIVARLESGQDFPGFKLVAGRSLRQWGDEATAEAELVKLLGDEAHTRKLISPAQAEKVLGKAKAKLIEPLTIKPEGKPTLASEDDKRPAVNLTKDDFECLQQPLV